MGGKHGDHIGATVAVENPLGRLTLIIQLPVPCRVGIGRVQEGWSKNGFVMCSSSQAAVTDTDDVGAKIARKVVAVSPATHGSVEPDWRVF
jgi:hypothetical protein